LAFTAASVFAIAAGSASLGEGSDELCLQNMMCPKLEHNGICLFNQVHL
jgi:hypothetical protein